MSSFQCLLEIFEFVFCRSTVITVSAKVGLVLGIQTTPPELFKNTYFFS